EPRAPSSQVRWLRSRSQYRRSGLRGTGRKAARRVAPVAAASSGIPSVRRELLLSRLSVEPWHQALIDEFFQHLPILEGVHGTPEPLMTNGEQLVGRDEAAERFFDKLLALAHVVEYLRSEDEEAPVDPEIGVLAQLDTLDLALGRHIDEVQTE